ncbi:MAG: hypothetical protein QM756_01525 [Polyangiaceae bacterium]
MSWFTFWRGHAGRGGTSPAPSAAASDAEADGGEEFTNYGVDAFGVMFAAHRRALNEGNQKDAEDLLNGLRALSERPHFSVTERSQLTLALHYARNAAEARSDAAAVQALTSELIQWLGREDPRSQAETWLAEGQRAFEQGQIEKALCSYERVIRQFSASTEPELRGLVALALLLRTTTQPPNIEAELRAYAHILGEFDTGQTASLRHCAAMVLFNKAIRLQQSGFVEAAIHTYSQLIDRFRSSADPNIQLQVAKALVNRGGIFAAMGVANAELRDYAEATERFESSPYLAIQRQVAFALCNQASVFDRTGQFREADEMRAQLTARFAESTDPLINQAISTAFESRVANRRRAVSKPD